MKIYNKVGSKERFLEIFQGINKIKLNEGIMQNYSKSGVLEVAFNNLKTGLLNIERSNTQTGDNESFVELTCLDKQNNNITFTFKVILNEDNQDGVYDIQDVALITFSFDSASDGESVEVDENELKEFNTKHKNEFFDVIDKYMDVEDGEPEFDELYEDSIKKIDSYPYGAKDRVGMIKPIQYADEKPTNPKLRVNAPELKKVVNETIDISKIADIIIQKAQDGHLKSLSPESKREYIELAINEIKNFFGNEITSMGSEEYINLISKIANAFFIEKMAKVNEDNFELPQEYDDTEISTVLDNNDDVNTLPGIHDPLPVDDEPIEEVPEEKKQIINQAYDNLITSGNQSPTMDQIQAEIKKLTGVVKPSQEDKPGQHMVGQRTYPEFADRFIEEEEEKSAYPKELGKEFSPQKQYNKKPKKYSKKIKIKENNYDELPSQQTTMSSIHQQVNDLDNQINVKYKKGEFYENKGTFLGIKNIKGNKYYVFKRHEADPSFNEYGKKYYTEKVFNLGENEEELTNVNLDSSTKQSNNIEQLAKEKEEAGDMIPGGKADDKSPLEFDLEQLSMGVDVENEHTDDPLIAFEIAMDHLAEFPDYYTRLKAMEDQAKSEEGDKKDEYNPANPDKNMGSPVEHAKKMGYSDKDTTDRLLGYQPKNVGDEVDEEIGYEEYNGNIGDRYADADGNEFAVRNKVKGGITLKGQGGEKEIATSSLGLMKKLNEFTETINNLKSNLLKK
jgi:hypothetical protein